MAGSVLSPHPRLRLHAVPAQGQPGPPAALAPPGCHPLAIGHPLRSSTCPLSPPWGPPPRLGSQSGGSWGLITPVTWPTPLASPQLQSWPPHCGPLARALPYFTCPARRQTHMQGGQTAAGWVRGVEGWGSRGLQCWGQHWVTVVSSVPLMAPQWPACGFASGSTSVRAAFPADPGRGSGDLGHLFLPPLRRVDTAGKGAVGREQSVTSE